MQLGLLTRESFTVSKGNLRVKEVALRSRIFSNHLFIFIQRPCAALHASKRTCSAICTSWCFNKAQIVKLSNSILNFTVMRNELFHLKFHGLYEKIAGTLWKRDLCNYLFKCISMKTFLEALAPSQERHQVDIAVVQWTRDSEIIWISLHETELKLPYSRLKVYFHEHKTGQNKTVWWW